jgi:PAS domain S-box-containing protein
MLLMDAMRESDTPVSLPADMDKARLWQVVCENATLAMFIMDERQHCIYMNPAAERLTGYALEETLGRPLHDVVHHTRPDGTPYPLSECPIDQAFPENMREQGEEVFVHKDGSFYPVAFTASPLKDEAGKPVGTIVEARSLAEEKAAAARLVETERRLGFALAAGRAVGTFHLDVTTGLATTDERVAELFGADPSRAGDGVPLSTLTDRIAERDRERVAAAIQRSIDEDEDYEEEYQVERLDGSVVWVLARGRCFRDEAGRPTTFPGVIIDITSQRRALEHARLLAGELNHRVKNTLQTVQAVARHSFREGAEPETAYEDFVGRVHALAGVHDLLFRSEWQPTGLHGVIDAALRPFGYVEGEEGRIVASGPEVALDAKQAQAFSMALHELATNAVKHGALSNDRGRVHVTWSRHGAKGLALEWRERGGPPVVPPKRSGFGTMMLTKMLAREVTGEITLDHAEEGLACRIVGEV